MDESFLSRLLPFISSGLEKGASRDYQAATLIMVAELCSRATLGKDFVKGEEVCVCMFVCVCVRVFFCWEYRHGT